MHAFCTTLEQLQSSRSRNATVDIESSGARGLMLRITLHREMNHMQCYLQSTETGTRLSLLVAVGALSRLGLLHVPPPDEPLEERDRDERDHHPGEEDALSRSPC